MSRTTRRRAWRANAASWALGLALAAAAAAPLAAQVPDVFRDGSNADRSAREQRLQTEKTQRFRSLNQGLESNQAEQRSRDQQRLDSIRRNNEQLRQQQLDSLRQLPPPRSVR